MEICSVPNCKLKPNTKHHSALNTAQLNLWRKVLKSTEKNFNICDQHLSIVCQSCMKSFETKNFANPGEILVISEKFQEVFGEVIGYEVSFWEFLWDV
jgi:hypothetical protein